MDKDAADDRADDAGHDALCARLRGEDVPISPAMVATARRHRLHLVLAAGAHADDLDREGHLLAGLRHELRQAVVVDVIRERALRELLDRFAAVGVDALLLKGAGLAYTLYPAACLRPRVDVDVMVARAALGRAERALVVNGWRRATEPDAELVTAQRHYVLGGATAIAEQLDLHWKIANPQLFGDAIAFDELRARAVPVTALGPHAWTVSAPDALFVACLHRVAHHEDIVDLLWLWDIHLIASSLSAEGRSLFAGLAARASMRAVCARGLELAFDRFPTPGDEDLIALLRPPPGGRPEPSARFLGGLRPVDVIHADLAALSGWRDRASLIREHLFPSVAYMRLVYRRCPSTLLPLAYVHRIVRGAPKWFQRGSGG